jgi:hypothetical protein
MAAPTLTALVDDGSAPTQIAGGGNHDNT